MQKLSLSVLVATAAVTAFAGRVSVSCPTSSIEEYRELAAYAKAIGATHLDACQVEPSMWQWNRDRYDPYPNWSMVRPSLFKFIVPDELKEYLPSDYAARNLAALKARAQVLAENGLKSEFSGFEPAFLPEEAYLDHPAWRGARCDQNRRGRTEYYAPCTDNAEIRAMYVRTVEEICRVCPFEAFRFRVNDSGSGLCWSRNQYPGANGPHRCRQGNYAQRVVDFLSIFQEGAAKAGYPSVKVNARADFSGDESAILGLLKSGQSINNKTAAGVSSEYVIGFPNRFLDYTAPIKGLSRVPRILAQLQEAQRHEGGDVSIGLRSFDEYDTKLVLETYLNHPIGEGPSAFGKALETVAAKIVKDADAVRLANAWLSLERGIASLDPMDHGGHVFLLGSLHQRWLIRPLVANPSKLSKEERAYYRDYQFQARSEKEADDLLDLQGTRWLDGYGGRCLVRQYVMKASAEIEKNALPVFRSLISSARDAEAKKYLTALVDRAEFYVLMLRNFQHVVEFQYLLDTIAPGSTPVDVTLDHSLQGDPRVENIEALIRAEIDNSLEMIEILERAKAPVVDQAPSSELESIMTYGPNIVGQLRKKVRIMEKHRHDVTEMLSVRNR